MTPSVFDQPYTILEPAYVKQPDYRIKTATTDNQPKAKQQETANYEQLKRYLDSTQQQQPSVIPTGATSKVFESLNPFRQIQTHYELKEQREQQEQKERELLREKGEGKGKNHRLRLIEERTQGYEELHRLIKQNVSASHQQHKRPSTKDQVVELETSAASLNHNKYSRHSPPRKTLKQRKR